MFVWCLFLDAAGHMGASGETELWSESVLVNRLLLIFNNSSVLRHCFPSDSRKANEATENDPTDAFSGLLVTWPSPCRSERTIESPPCHESCLSCSSLRSTRSCCDQTLTVLKWVSSVWYQAYFWSGFFRIVGSFEACSVKLNPKLGCCHTECAHYGHYGHVIC